MKRLQISIDEELDEALAVEAVKQKKSKAALIREYIRDRLTVGKPDPLDLLNGIIDDEPGADIDDVVYNGR